MIKYYESMDEILPIPILGFCAGWKKPLNEQQILEILKNSAYRVIAVDMDRHKVVGIITALSDEVNWAFIPFLEVISDYKKMGIGKELLTKMLSLLESINCIDLTCDTEMQSFYEKFGMLKSNGMVIRRYLNDIWEYK